MKSSSCQLNQDPTSDPQLSLEKWRPEFPHDTCQEGNMLFAWHSTYRPGATYLQCLLLSTSTSQLPILPDTRATYPSSTSTPRHAVANPRGNHCRTTRKNSQGKTCAAARSRRGSRRGKHYPSGRLLQGVSR